MKEFENEDKLWKMLNNIYGWSQTIKMDAHRTRNDGNEDTALIIQKLIESYLDECGIDRNNVIEYDKYQKYWEEFIQK